MRFKFVLLVSAVLATEYCFADDLPDAPRPKTGEISTVSTPVFWDRPQRISYATFAVVGIADVAQSCYLLAHGWSEEWMPTRNCGGLVAIGLGAAVGLYVLERELWGHKHYKLLRIVRIIAPMPNLLGLSLSTRKRIVWSR